MKMLKQVLVQLAFLLLFTYSASAQYMPEQGSAEREAIMDALRVPVRRELKKNMVFRVNLLRVKDGWAVISATPLKPGGSAFDWNGTKYAKCIRDGDCDKDVQALLKKSGNSWRVVDYGIGATDWGMGYACEKRKCPVELRQ
jgi:hypothetical protein